MKLTDNTYVCNSLTNFEYKAHTYSRNQIVMKEPMKSYQVNLFLAGFNHLEPLCGCCCEIILMYCSFFFFSSNSHHTTPPHKTNHCMICTYAVHPPTQLYKKTTTPCAPPLQTEGPNFVSITAITYILQLPTTKKHPIIHIAARSILL